MAKQWAAIHGLQQCPVQLGVTGCNLRLSWQETRPATEAATLLPPYSARPATEQYLATLSLLLSLTFQTLLQRRATLLPLYSATTNIHLPKLPPPKFIFYLLPCYGQKGTLLVFLAISNILLRLAVGGTAQKETYIYQFFKHCNIYNSERDAIFNTILKISLRKSFIHRKHYTVKDQSNIVFCQNYRTRQESPLHGSRLAGRVNWL